MSEVVDVAFKFMSGYYIGDINAKSRKERTKLTFILDSVRSVGGYIDGGFSWGCNLADMIQQFL